jgi:hypothetical protein
MVDGFGWFENVDYRRSWLFFDDVLYILPRWPAPPLVYPRGLLERKDCLPVMPELSRDAWLAVREAAQLDAADPEFRKIASSISQNDMRYTFFVARSDRSMSAALKLDSTFDRVLAVALLLEKLLLYAAANGLVPIVGRRWAAELLEARLSRGGQPAGRALLSPTQGETYATFSAGLSLDFIDDSKLSLLPFDRLRTFKDDHRDLLHRHQLHLIEVARAFAALPNHEGRETALVDLRLDAMKKRAKLDDEARQSVLALGLDLVKKGIDNAFSKEGIIAGTATALALNHSLGALLGGALVAGLGQSMAGFVELWRSRRAHQQELSSLAYLFATRRL